jgi:photosystem II stability/assembly factor-like uncharacterized protein
MIGLVPILALVVLATSSRVNAQAPAVIARDVAYSLEVNTTESPVPFLKSVGSSGATFLTVHFSRFHLAPGDSVIVRSPDNTSVYEYTDLGRGDLGESGGFFSSVVSGSQVILEYFPASAEKAEVALGDFGFAVDKLTRSSSTASTSTTCGTDDTVPSKCLQNDSALPLAYTKARAVARLFVNGSISCTGWLVGSEGHLITNNHCIDGAKAAAMTDFEFDAESASCSEQCQVKNGCQGVIAATSATLLTTDEDLDYTLVKLTPSATANLSDFGFLTLRVAGATQGEQIYLPQHPKGWAKRIAAVEDDGNVTTIAFVDYSSACGDHRIGYYADTQTGSSGSPVIAAADNSVVALHNCGVLGDVCVNAGIDVRSVIYDLREKAIVPADALDNAAAEIPDGPWLPGATSAPTPAPTPAPTVSICSIFRQQLTCETVVPGSVCVWKNSTCVPNS